MSFRLIPNSVTLDDLEPRNRPNRRVISRNLVAFGTDWVKVVEDTPILSAAEGRKSYMSFRLVPKLLTLNDLERNNDCYIASGGSRNCW